jgi:hypothetical protein
VILVFVEAFLTLSRPCVKLDCYVFEDQVMQVINSSSNYSALPYCMLPIVASGCSGWQVCRLRGLNE